MPRALFCARYSFNCSLNSHREFDPFHRWKNQGSQREINGVSVAANHGQKSSSCFFCQAVTLNSPGMNAFILQMMCCWRGVVQRRGAHRRLGYKRTFSTREWSEGGVLKFQWNLARWRGPKRFFKGREISILTQFYDLSSQMLMPMLYCAFFVGSLLCCISVLRIVCQYACT